MTRDDSPSLDYIRSLYAPQDALLTHIAQQLQAMGVPMQVEPEVGRLLQVLIRLRGVKRILEVGTLGGSSAIWMARALPEGGTLVTINKDAPHIALAKESFAACEVGHRITMLEGDAHHMLPTLADAEAFDMMFIDADKISYNDYLDWAEAHLPKGALIVADNTLLGGKLPLDGPQYRIAPTTRANMLRFNERLADRARYDGTMVPTQSGLSIAIKLF
jgi:predicted O-methyltransferase YrrM